MKQGGKIGGVIGLHARGLHIEQVLIDGVEAQFEIEEFHAHIQPPQNSKSLVETADDAYRKYSEDLYLEMQPELLIHPPASSTPAGEEPKDPQEVNPVSLLRVISESIIHAPTIAEVVFSPPNLSCSLVMGASATFLDYFVIHEVA